MGRSIRNKPSKSKGGGGVSKSQLQTKADIQTVTDLQTLVESTKASTADVDNLQTSLDTKASAESVTALQNQVNDKADTTTVTSLQASLNTTVLQTDLNALEADVNSVGAIVTSDRTKLNDMVYMYSGYVNGRIYPEPDMSTYLSNWQDYNWIVSMSATQVGYEHDYDRASGHSGVRGNDNYSSNTWDGDDSEYNYAFIGTNNKLYLWSYHRNGGTWIPKVGRYHLLGIKKTSSLK